jgi:membrane-bound lytic murein transglycosylase A
MLGQDTGGAIRGAVRADFFWGFGEDAAREAGRMKQALKMWVLLPNSFRPQDPASRMP